MKKTLGLALVVLSLANVCEAGDLRVACEPAAGSDIALDEEMNLYRVSTATENGKTVLQVKSAPNDGREILRIATYRIDDINLKRGVLRISTTEQVGAVTGQVGYAVLTAATFEEKKPVKASLTIVPSTTRVTPRVGKTYSLVCTISV